MREIPLRYAAATYDDVPTEIRNIFEKIPQSRRGIYIFGGVGAGKTHIAYALLKSAREKAPMTYELPLQGSWEEKPRVREADPMFWNTTELLRELRLEFDRKGDAKKNIEEEIMEHKGILLLDDIGAEKSTEWVMETFYLIINHRYEESLPTIFTSNMSLSDLYKVVGERLASRIAEMCYLIKVEGQDRRVEMMGERPTTVAIA